MEFWHSLVVLLLVLASIALFLAAVSALMDRQPLAALIGMAVACVPMAAANTLYNQFWPQTDQPAVTVTVGGQ